MKIEHFAFNTKEPLKMADWYVENLNMNIERQQKESPYTTFLSDESRSVMIEIYRNPPEEVPDYEAMNPLIVHLAFVSENPDADRRRLENKGASTISDDRLEDGSHLVMLRDPWGFCIQLCKRGTPMISFNS